MADERERSDRGVLSDRHKLYVLCGFAGVAVAMLGIWLSPVSAEIGRREMTLLYHVGWFVTSAGSIVTIACVVLTVVDTR